MEANIWISSDVWTAEGLNPSFKDTHIWLPNEGQWLWHSWQRGGFQHQRSAVQIQSSVKFIRTIICIEKTKKKKKRPTVAPLRDNIMTTAIGQSRKDLTSRWKNDLADFLQRHLPSIWHHQGLHLPYHTVDNISLERLKQILVCLFVW